MVCEIVSVEQGKMDAEQSYSKESIEGQVDDNKQDGNNEEFANNVGQNITSVLLMNTNDKHTENIKKCYHIIVVMIMKNREKDIIENTEQINTLRERWLSGRMKTINVNNGITIQCGSVVKVSEGSMAPLFLVYTVYKVSGSTYFPQFPETTLRDL